MANWLLNMKHFHGWFVFNFQYGMCPGPGAAPCWQSDDCQQGASLKSQLLGQLMIRKLPILSCMPWQSHNWDVRNFLSAPWFIGPDIKFFKSQLCDHSNVGQQPWKHLKTLHQKRTKKPYIHSKKSTCFYTEIVIQVSQSIVQTGEQCYSHYS